MSHDDVFKDIEGSSSPEESKSPSKEVLADSGSPEVALEATKLTGHNTILWMTYDCADTFWNTMNVTALTPYALLLGMTHGMSYGTAFMWISIFLAISNFFIAISAPPLGAMADTMRERKTPVLICASIYFVITYIIPAYMQLFWVLPWWIISNLAYQLGRNFYDAQIPFVTGAKTRHVVQAIGGGLSFFGALFAIALSILVKIFWGPWTAINDENDGTDVSLLSFGGVRQYFWFCLAFFVVIIFPYLFHHEQTTEPTKESMSEIVKKSGRSTLITLKEIVSSRNGLLFTIAWFLISDAASAGQAFMPLMLQGAAGVSSSQTDYNFLVGIPASIIAGLLIGFPLRFFGCRICLIATACTNLIAEGFMIMAIYRVGTWTTYVSSIFSGAALGFIWIVGRQFIIELSPPSKLTQWGGFQRISGRVGSVFSPLIYSAIVKSLSDDHSVKFAYFIAVLVRSLLFIIGITITWFIVDPHKRYVAGERAPYEGLYEKGGREPRPKEEVELTVVNDQ
ncbi:MFS transporter [Pelomyxa schiedti]|nr:MFS transporter [Pelomyxa schiedti]